MEKMPNFPEKKFVCASCVVSIKCTNKYLAWIRWVISHGNWWQKNYTNSFSRLHLQSHGERLVDKLCIFQSQSVNRSEYGLGCILLSEPDWAKESSNWTGPVSDSPSVLLMSETEPRPVQFWAEAPSLCHRAVVVVVVVVTVHRSLKLSYHFYFVVFPFTHQASWC